MSINRMRPSKQAEVISAFHKILFVKDEERVEEDFRDIMREQVKLSGEKENRFAFRDVIYEYAKHEGKYTTPIPILDFSLRSRFKDYLEQHQRLQQEANVITGFLQRIMCESDRLTDMLNMIPPNLHYIVEEIRHLFEFGAPRLDQKQFLADNERFTDVLKSRMVYNLIDRD